MKNAKHQLSKPIQMIRQPADKTGLAVDYIHYKLLWIYEIFTVEDV